MLGILGGALGCILTAARNSKFEWQSLAAARPKAGCALWQQTRLPCCGELATALKAKTELNSTANCELRAEFGQPSGQSIYAYFDSTLLPVAI